MSDHFLPFRAADLERAALEGRSADEATVLHGLRLLLERETQERQERLSDRYHAMDPNRDTRPVPGLEGTADPAAFVGELDALMERANYRKLTDREFQDALERESLVQVKLVTRLDDFAELAIYVRGSTTRQETVKTLFGLRSRTIEVETYERVLIFVRFKDAAHFGKRTVPFAPGTTQLKLFANVPAADIEMLMPNCEVRMKPLDLAMIGIPAVIGIITMLAKVMAVLAFLWAATLWMGQQAGIHDKPVEFGSLAAQATAVLGAGIAVGLFVGRQLMRYRFKKIQFLKALSDSLYFRNLDNNAGAYHRVLDEAREEEIKEAQLGWRFLRDGPQTEAALDARVEAWFQSRLGLAVDFEVDDALAKIERLGVAHREGETWTALEPAAAKAVLGQRWNSLLP